MRRALAPLLAVFKCILLSLLLYALCRLLFYFFNFNYFQALSLKALLLLFLAGIRFDISSILMLQGIFVLCSLLPGINKEHRVFQKSMKTLFLLSLGVGLLSNCIDFSYFRFTLKRSTAELFQQQGDIGNLLGQYVLDYWYIAAIWIALLYVAFRCYPLTEKVNEQNLPFFRRFLLELLVFLLVVPLGVLGVRGGFQVKPLRVITAAEYTEARYIPLVINSPFSIIKSFDASHIKAYDFMPPQQAIQAINFRHEAKGPMKKENVVVIILESFSKEYIGYYNNGKGYTPFLDSLLDVSLVAEQAYANGKKSIEGIPAVIAGVPSLLENPYLTSVYGANSISGLGTLLKNKGYACSFFHGGSNGTMGFDAFAKLAGFDHYFGRTEYNNEADYDGNWGIYDEAFYHYFVQQLNQQKSPFCAAFFSLSSHHPYSIPSKLANKFPKGTLEIHASIGYADYSLRSFFHAAKETQWFKNTLFVLCADHTSLSASPFYQGNIGSYAIPVAYYKADGSLKGKLMQCTQQIDILPSVLDYLQYDSPYFAFGSSVFDSLAPHFAINYKNGNYQFIQDKRSLLFDGEKTNAYFNFEQDSMQQQNLVMEKSAEKISMELKLKAFIQQYNRALLDNKMIVP